VWNMQRVNYINWWLTLIRRGHHYCIFFWQNGSTITIFYYDKIYTLVILSNYSSFEKRYKVHFLNRQQKSYKYATFTKEFDGILKIPKAGSIFSSLAKDTSGRNQAQVTWTHNGSISVGFRAPPECPTIHFRL
jgi:hypothetical protein